MFTVGDGLNGGFSIVAFAWAVFWFFANIAVSILNPVLTIFGFPGFLQASHMLLVPIVYNYFYPSEFNMTQFLNNSTFTT